MESYQGYALVASPHLTDPNFARAVVYIVRHDEHEGAFGLILNRRTNAKVSELLEQLSDQSICNEEPVYCGGPVDGPLVLLQSVIIDSHRLIAMATDQEQILALCEHDQDDVWYRIFDGYSGWTTGQLEDEMKTGSWLLWDVQPEQIFSDTEQLWQQAIQSIGRDVLSRGIDPSRIPEDPAYN